MFRGIYRDKRVHKDDFNDILERAYKIGMKKIIITASNLQESKEALELAKTDPRLYLTVGIHPTRCNEFKEENYEEYFSNLSKIIEEGKDKVVAIGECGLDYDRLYFCPKEMQLRNFQRQFDLSEKYKLPMFLHDRNTGDDFYNIMHKNRDRIAGGVVHSFTGTKEEALKLLNLNLSIGINGCSLKTEEELEVVKSIPDDRIMIETDAPWCDIRPTHASYKYIKTKWDLCKKEKYVEGKLVKSRNEPCVIVNVLEVISGVKGKDMTELGKMYYQNTMNLFFPNESA